MESHFISCDWGTSNLRLYLVERDSLIIVAEISNKTGIKDFYQNWMRAPSDRKLHYLQFLGEQLEILGNQSQKDTNNLPVIASGMITSSLGIEEIPYAKIPIMLQPSDLEIRKFGRFILVSGLQSQKDVMRGEETQILGILENKPNYNGMIILPGTHSKHVHIQNGKLINFMTFMSGEIFQLLAQNSSITHTIEPCDVFKTKKNKEAFLRGVSEAAHSNFLNIVFHARTKALLNGTSKKENYAYLSGLVIGYELSDLLIVQKHIFISGERSLCGLYQIALEHIGFTKPEYFSDKMATIKGHALILKGME